MFIYYYYHHFLYSDLFCEVDFLNKFNENLFDLINNKIVTECMGRKKGR